MVGGRRRKEKLGGVVKAFLFFFLLPPGVRSVSARRLRVKPANEWIDRETDEGGRRVEVEVFVWSVNHKCSEWMTSLAHRTLPTGFSSPFEFFILLGAFCRSAAGSFIIRVTYM